MAVDIHKLIAAIRPEVYCKKYKEERGRTVNVLKAVKAAVKEGGYIKAAEVAEIRDAATLEIEKAEEKALENLFKAPVLKDPIEKHSIVYDTSSAGTQLLEEIYFKILDVMSKEFKQVDKVVDSFAASPGSGYFAEMSMKATRMQEEAMKILGGVNQVVKSILNIVYDLKEFKMRLSTYDRYKSKNPTEKRAAFLSLKQIWMDTVDIKRGNTSIKGLALGGQAEFITLLDAFMAVESLENIKKLDLNERVRRILETRVSEFLRWIKESERELRKRFEIEKTYLKSQVNTVKLYARWAKPYLKTAKALEQRIAPSAALVTVFNTVLFELSLLGAHEYNIKDQVDKGILPRSFLRASKKEYRPVIVIEIKFSSTPQTVGQHQRFRGEMEATFTSYALNDQELKALKEEIEKDDLGDIIGVFEGITEENFAQLRVDIDEFTKEEEPKEEESKVANPFAALFSFLKPKKKAKKPSEMKEKKLPVPLPGDTSFEKVLRSMTALEGRKKCKKIFDTFKKEYNLPTF